MLNAIYLLLWGMALVALAKWIDEGPIAAGALIVGALLMFGSIYFAVN